MRTFKFRVYIPELEKFTYFGLNDFAYSDRYLHQRDYPVQQFADTIDINGEDIYEGDIVKRKGTPYVYAVEYSLTPLGYRLVDPDGDSIELWYHRDKLEVIGNIHQNKNLLKR
jgi:hypothetical protein